MKTLKETQTVSEADKVLLDQLRQGVQRFLPTATVLLYGSVARGTPGPESDYDILIVVDEPLSAQEEDRIRDSIFDLEMASGAVISTQFISKNELIAHSAMPFLLEVGKDGILL